ncbi:MAG: jag protein, spoIIIJ-associated protein [Candidatus Peregrinibacteria bacterium GW2011_GWF2_38_29]|nr:MAG: jag protein, spoIIIJ-associated protein [Candidatus Peregrinibacteria bacterium GW2011_GWF2_38_29]HBB02797.1 hypothetical protein [Candidatus Peregrinibacteria bacterium]
MDIKNDFEDILRELLNKALRTFTGKIEITEENETYRVNIISPEDSAVLIGYHGETLQALQHIYKTLIFRKFPDKKISLTLDIDNYKKAHEDSLIQLAERKVSLARKNNQTQIMPPMPAYMRRLIHMHLLQEQFSDIATESVGEGESRQVTIKLKDAA